MKPPTHAAAGRHALLRCAAFVALAACAAAEPMTLSHSRRHFDGVDLAMVELKSDSIHLVTDTLGAWTVDGGGTTDTGFVFRHRSLPSLTLTLSPFTGPGPGRTADSWRSHGESAAARLGPGAKFQDLGLSGTPGGTPSFASWPTREASLAASPESPPPLRAERHFAASDGTRGILIVLAGAADEVERALGDCHFLLARLERQ